MKRRRRFDRSFDRIRSREEAGVVKRRSVNRRLQKMLNNRLSVFGLIVFTLIVGAAIIVPVISRYEPQTIDLRNRLQPPSWDHILGTDQLGRDLFVRIIAGGRISIAVGLGGALGAALIGVTLGCYGGYRGGLPDATILRVSEVFVAFPQIVLILLLVTLTGQSLANLIIIFVVTGWSPIYRMTRARMFSLREEEFVLALRAFGLRPTLIAFKHVLPNASGPILVNITLRTATYILAEAALSYLGLGVPLHLATWGNILNAAQELRILTNNWWMWLPVGIVISLFVLSVNFIGDGMRDSTDPSQQG